MVRYGSPNVCLFVLLLYVPSQQLWHAGTYILNLKGLASYQFYQYYCLRVNRVYAELYLSAAIFKEAVHSDDP